MASPQWAEQVCAALVRQEQNLQRGPRRFVRQSFEEGSQLSFVVHGCETTLGHIAYIDLNRSAQSVASRWRSLVDAVEQPKRFSHDLGGGEA